MRSLPTLVLLAASGLAHAVGVRVQVDGVDGELQSAALAGVELSSYATREVSTAQVRRLYRRAPAQIARALEPYGYYNVKVDGELNDDGKGWIANLHVHAGDPVTVAEISIALPGDARDQSPVAKALAQFAPASGAALNQPAYERSKNAVQAALLETGYLDADLAVHRVEVSRSDNRAKIFLEWEPGAHYKLGPARFVGGQFNDGFLDRYVPWVEGEFYTQGKLLALQQRLVDADYFGVIDVQPDMEHAQDGSVPILITITPAKRTVYTAGVFVDTDTGFGVRGGIQRRWINQSGHKFRVDTEIAQRLKSAAALYTIPLPGNDNRALNFGIAYKDENTRTSQSKTASAVTSLSREWHGFTETAGLHLLTGDFEVADEKGSSTLLYPEFSFGRKQTDDPLFTRRGYSFGIIARAAASGIVSDTSFVQLRADAKWIHGIGDHQRVILRGTLGTTTVGDFSELPPDLRFFAGGDRSIRGYAYQTIGPRNDAGKVIGGKDLAVFSSEYEYYFSEHWGMAVFIDSGDAFSGATFDMKIGAGFGLRWRSPVGMVRVDLGTPINDEFNSGVQLHLTIGPDL
jgi:translocation and assembly module TamA